ncbi:MAG: hypothetical protein ACERK9_01850, partial [Deltaproteobacteria bacterium]
MPIQKLKKLTLAADRRPRTSDLQRQLYEPGSQHPLPDTWKKSYWNHSFYVDNPWSDVNFLESTSRSMVLFVANVDGFVKSPS